MTCDVIPMVPSTLSYLYFIPSPVLGNFGQFCRTRRGRRRGWVGHASCCFVLLLRAELLPAASDCSERRRQPWRPRVS